MNTFKILNFILFAGLLSGSSRCIEVIEHDLRLKGHKSGIYIRQNDKPTGVNVMGVEAMFQEIDDKTAIYAIFEYDNNNSSACIAKEMLDTAIKAKPTKVNWKSFLEAEMVKIETRLMRDNVPAAEAESSTRALVVVVDGSTVTTAQVGLSEMTVFVKNAIDSSKFDFKFMNDNLSGQQIHNILGGKIAKRRHSRIRGDAVITQSNDPEFIVMGTTSFWRNDDYDTAEFILKNEKDYKKAANAIANIRNAPSAKKSDYGVIIVALQKGTKLRSIVKSISNFVQC